MTAKEWAKMLNGREYGNEITRDEEALAKDNGIVVVFGYSDDCMELCGAISDEGSCFGGREFYVAKGRKTPGVMLPPAPYCGDKECFFFKETIKRAKKLKACCQKDCGDGPFWSYQTEIPHETFNIYEDEELFCVGIVFSVNDL